MKQYTFAGKSIFIFEKHHEALLPWSNLKKAQKEKDLYLFSFDHHTDTHDPFLDYSYNNEFDTSLLLRDIDISSELSIKNTIDKLKNDEHIKTAICLGIIEKAFIISHDNLSDNPISNEENDRLNDREKLIASMIDHSLITPCKNRTYPDSDIYIPPFYTDGRCEHGNEYDVVVLEDMFLKDKLDILARMCPSVINLSNETILQKPYILDIDLDYFHTLVSTQPKNYSIFRNLVLNAEIITIAQEPVCVDICKSDENVTSAKLEKNILELIEKILREKI